MQKVDRLQKKGMSERQARLGYPLFHPHLPETASTFTRRIPLGDLPAHIWRIVASRNRELMREAIVSLPWFRRKFSSSLTGQSPKAERKPDVRSIGVHGDTHTTNEWTKARGHEL